MAKKTQPNFNEAVNFNFKDLLKAINFDDILFVESLAGEDRREFFKFCNQVYNNKFFTQIIKNFVHTQVMFTAEEAMSHDQYMFGKAMCQGIKTVEDFFRKYSSAYDAEFTPKDEKFDARKSFSPQKV